MMHGRTRARHPYVEIDLDRARKIATEAGATTDQERARIFGLTPSTWSRLIHEERPPTSRVIAAVLSSRQELRFYDLFRVRSK